MAIDKYLTNLLQIKINTIVQCLANCLERRKQSNPNKLRTSRKKRPRKSPISKKKSLIVKSKSLITRIGGDLINLMNGFMSIFCNI